MHIAFLTPEYPHPKILHSAGIGTSIKNLAVELVKNNHAVTVFVYSQDANEVFEEDGITIHKIAYKKYLLFSWFLYRKRLQNHINNIVKTSQIDIIEAPDWTGITAFMNLKCPLLIRLHGSDTYFCHLENRKQKWKNFWFEKLALKRATCIVSVSKFTANTTKNLFQLNKTISVIHNGINVDEFSLSNRNLIELNTILYFGSIIRKKGVLELVPIFNEVVKQNFDAKLICIGKDVKDVLEKKSTVELIKENLSNEALKSVEFIEEVPYHLIKKHIAKANVIVLPSFAEAFPMTWLEAMAMEKALVTSNIGWASELMIDGETGYIENPKNHEGYASKIIKLLVDKELNATMGKKAREHIVTNFSQELIGNQNIEYYKSIILAK